MGRMKDETGKTYGRLKVIEVSHKGRGGYYWSCMCNCGERCVVLGTDLRRGHSKSCGCYNREMSSKKHTIHGLRGTRIATIHENMKARCNNPNNTSYSNYGERGIRVCDEWSKLEKFAEWAFENGYRDNLTIERVDNNKGYEPDNCIWITKREQDFNKRINKNNKTGYSGIGIRKNKSGERFTARITVDGKSYNLGTFDTFLEAYKVRRESEVRFFGRYLYDEPIFAEIDGISKITKSKEK